MTEEEIEAGACALYVDQHGAEWTTEKNSTIADMYRRDARLVLEAAEAVAAEGWDEDE